MGTAAWSSPQEPTPMKNLLIALLALFHGALSAQSCIYTADVDPALPGSIGTGFFGAPDANLYYRKHYLVPATLFANVPLRITDLSLAVRQGWRRLRLPQVTVRMGQTTRTQLSNTFAQNITSPLQDVLVATDHIMLEGIGPTWVPIGMQQPYQFLPGQGNLLIEVIQYGGSVLDQTGFNDLSSASWNVTQAVTSGFETGVPTAGGQSFTIPRFRLCTDHPELSLSGLGCGGSTNTPPTLGLAGQPSLGSQTTFWLGNAVPNGLGILALGFDNRAPFPIDLASQGAPGCRQYFPIATTIAVVTDNVGLGQYVLPIPNSASAVGQMVLGQFAGLRPGSNALGVLTSNYGRILVGR